MSDQKTTTIRVRGLAVEWPCDDLFDELARVRTAKDALEARVTELEAVNKRLTALVREAYLEGYSQHRTDLYHSDTPPNATEAWEVSDANTIDLHAALAAVGAKEANDG